eukprot:6176224-Pleurochrysis_carterae.AAC.1
MARIGGTFEEVSTDSGTLPSLSRKFRGTERTHAQPCRRARHAYVEAARFEEVSRNGTNPQERVHPNLCSCEAHAYERARRGSDDLKSTTLFRAIVGFARSVHLATFSSAWTCSRVHLLASASPGARAIPSPRNRRRHSGHADSL